MFFLLKYSLFSVVFKMYSKVIQLRVCVYTIFVFLFRLFSILGYYKMPNMIPCAIQQALVAYLLYILSMGLLTLTPNVSSPQPLIFGDHKFVFCICDYISVL